MWRRSPAGAFLAWAGMVVWCLLHARLAAVAAAARASLPGRGNVSKPAVCVSNGNGANPRTASLWLRGTPERYGSRYRFYLRNSTGDGCLRGDAVAGASSAKPFISLALVNPVQTRWAMEHPTWPAVRDLCKGEELCIATGDELCQFPQDFPQHHHVIMRQYYTSKYPYPGLPLGPRYEFRWVPYSDRVRAGPRKYVFNFLGSITKVKPDRLEMQKVVEGHQWPQPIKWGVVNQLVSVSQNAQEYRDILLDSSFTLCPVGTGDDNFRFWEAIEAGSIPIFVPRDESLRNAKEVLEQRGERDCPDSFMDVLRTAPPIVVLRSWAELPTFIAAATETQVATHRRHLARWNHEFWRNTTRALDDAIERGVRAK